MRATLMYKAGDVRIEHVPDASIQRLRKADFGQRRLFQLGAVALACRGGLEYSARDLGFGQCPEHRRGVWFGGSPLLLPLRAWPALPARRGSTACLSATG